MSRVKCGVHGRADGRATEADFIAITDAKLDAVKLLSTADPAEIDRLRQINPQMYIMVRLFIGGLDNRIVTSEQAARDWEWEARQFYNRGVREFEVHNESNLVIEGWGKNWRGGLEFAIWWADVIHRLRRGFPDAHFGWPGLSPGGDVPGVRADSVQFLAEARDLIMTEADFICAHSYFINEGSLAIEAAGMAWRVEKRRFPNKPLHLTEYSNPRHDVPHAEKGRQYVKYLALFERETNPPESAFCFCVSGSSFEHEGWRLENGSQTEIPKLIGARNTTPVPTPTKPYTLLAQPWDGRVDRKYPLVNIRDLAGVQRKTVPPGTLLRISSEPFFIPGHVEYGKRLLVNTLTEWNILADRMVKETSEPDPGGAPLRWPTDIKAVNQAWGLRPEVYKPLGVPAHEGVDIRAPSGSSIYAAGDGVVTRVEANNRAYGVCIRHSWEYQGRKFELVYAHGVPSSIHFEVGDVVKAGDVLMLADSTGNVTGAHLHFSMKEPGVTFTDKDAQGRDRVWPFSITDPTPFLPKV